MSLGVVVVDTEPLCLPATGVHCDFFLTAQRTATSLLGKQRVVLLEGDAILVPAFPPPRNVMPATLVFSDGSVVTRAVVGVPVAGNTLLARLAVRSSA